MSRGLGAPSPDPSQVQPKRKPKTQANGACILSTSRVCREVGSQVEEEGDGGGPAVCDHWPGPKPCPRAPLRKMI